MAQDTTRPKALPRSFRPSQVSTQEEGIGTIDGVPHVPSPMARVVYIGLSCVACGSAPSDEGWADAATEFRGGRVQAAASADCVTDTDCDDSDPATTDICIQDVCLNVAQSKACLAPGGLPPVVINELMVNPEAVPDVDGEWIELYNRTLANIDINGWVLSGSNGSKTAVLGSEVPLEIPALGYFVLCRNADPGVNGGIGCDFAYDPSFALEEPADGFVLMNHAAVVIDEVSYDANWPSPVPGGASVALQNPDADNQLGANWRLSLVAISATNLDAGSPGSRNTDVFQELQALACDDGKPCTWDVCDSITSFCTHPKKASCCVVTADCQPPTPCQIAQCSGGQCFFASLPVTLCCAVDTECDDGTKCTQDYCASNACTHASLPGPAGKTCCDPLASAPVATQCDDGLLCTLDTCQGGGCVHAPDGSCCDPSLPDQCDDWLPCTLDTCVGNSCVNESFGQDCCYTGADCPDDGNPCTASICDNTGPDLGTCVQVMVEPCTVCPPWIEAWSGAAGSPEGISSHGWETWSNPSATSDAADNWRIATNGDLGPDEHVRFNLAPRRTGFDGCLISPRIDSTGSLPCFTGSPSEKPWNLMAMQFESGYELISPGAKIWVFAYEGGGVPPASYSDVVEAGWSVLGTLDGSTQSASWKRRIETFDLSGSEHYGSTGTRFAFCVQGADSFALERFSIDDIKVGFGRAPVWGRQCPGSPPVPGPPSEVTVVAGTSEEFLLAASVPGLNAAGLVEPLLFSVVVGPATLKFLTPSYTFGACGYFYNSVVIDGSKTLAPGDHVLELLVSDGFFQQRHEVTVHVLPGAGYLVWQPAEVTSQAGAQFQAAIAEYEDRPAHLVSDLDLYDADALANLDGVFVVLGSRAGNHVLTAAEAEKLRAALLAGGHVYLEGGEVWGDDPETQFHRMFRARSTPGSTSVTGKLFGRNLLAGGLAATAPEWVPGTVNPFHNAYVDAVDVAPGKKSFPLLREELATDSKGRNLMVGFDAAAESPLSTWRTVASSLSFSALSKEPAGSALGRDALLRKIVDFFENGTPLCTPCSAPLDPGCQCDDGNPCTTTTCGADGQCQNPPVPGCTPCASDQLCGDGQACRVDAGACLDIAGRRVRATPTLGIDTAPGTALRVIDVDLCPAVGTNQLGSLAVKVRVNHTWRGQLSITLVAPGGAVHPLRSPEPSDGGDGVFETYDLGVSTGNVPTTGTVCVPGKPWQVRIEDTVVGADSGFVDEVSLFVVEAAP